MTTQAKGKWVFDDPVTFNSTTTQTGAAAVTGDLTVTGAISASTTVTAGTGLTVTSGGATVTAGGITVTAGGQTITAGNLTVTAGNLVVTAGTADIGSTVTAAGFINDTADVTTTDSAYALAANVTGVNCVSTGAGGPYAITLGNNSSGHVVHIYASAINTGTFTVATAEGTTTLDATDESVTVRYNGTAWRVIGYHGTTGPA